MWGRILIIAGFLWSTLAGYYLFTGAVKFGLGPNFHGFMLVVGCAAILVGEVLRRKGK